MSNSKIFLTTREREVLNMLSQGSSSRDISAQLYISSNTVEYHRKQLLRKTASRNVAHLISNAYKLRLLRVDD